MRNQATLMIVVCTLEIVTAMAVVYLQHSKAVANGDARSTEQEMVGVVRVHRVGTLIQEVIKNQHGHHDCLTCTSSHLECSTGQYISIIL